MAALISLAGMVAAANGFIVNGKVSAQVKQLQHQAASGDNSQEPSAPSSVRPSNDEVANYAVSPTMPRYIDIPRLKVHSRIMSEGVAANNQLQVPWNIFDGGWYNASSLPGQQGGMLIDGHSGIGQQHGIFYGLNTLKNGDAITITRGDGRQFTYSVVKVQTVSARSVDMASMVVSADTSKPGLNLITCAGDQIPGTNELNQRVQVYAVLR